MVRLNLPVFLLVAIPWLAAPADAQLTGAEAPRHPELPPPPQIDERNVHLLEFQIPSTRENVSRAIVVVPRRYEEQGAGPAARAKRYPAVYLLHGYSGDYTDWYLKTKDTRSSLIAMADRYDLILVAPDGRYCSWYLNAPPDGTEDPADWQWETVITRHLVPEVDRKYRTWAEPQGRGITGLSMGGHGALYLAARNLDLFGACGSMSGVMDLTNTSRPYALARRVGPKNEYRDRWIEYSAITAVEKLVDRDMGLLIDCGVEDIFIDDNRVFREKLLRLNIPHEYIERPGGHTWDYWRNALPYHLQFLSDRLKPAGRPEQAGRGLPERQKISGRPAAAESRMPAFRTVVVADKLPDDPYGIDVADMNGDGKPDIVLTRFFGVDWYEAPDWKRHAIVTDATRQNIAGVAHDVDGDGILDVAIAADWEFNDTENDGSLWWAKGGTGQTPWPITRIDGEPSIHRAHWADTNGDGQRQLLVSPLKGRGTTPPHFAERGIRLLLYHIPDDPATLQWPAEVIDESLHVCHASVPVQFDDDPADEILTASFEGVTLFDRQADGSWRKQRLGSGDQESSPNRGSSEVALGRLQDGRRIIATIEPWHGHQVVVYVEPVATDRGQPGGVAQPPPAESRDQAGVTPLWPRFVLDDTFDQGHGIACGDLDGDGNDEIIAGYRGPNREHGRPTSLKAYQVIDADAGKWTSHWIDEGDMATEALQVVDMNGDGRLDIVAAGRSTRNLKIYLNGGIEN